MSHAGCIAVSLTVLEIGSGFTVTLIRLNWLLKMNKFGVMAEERGKGVSERIKNL